MNSLSKYRKDKTFIILIFRIKENSIVKNRQRIFLGVHSKYGLITAKESLHFFSKQHIDPLNFEKYIHFH